MRLDYNAGSPKFEHLGLLYLAQFAGAAPL